MTGQASVIQAALMQRVARNIRVAQAAAGVSNLQLAEATGVSPRTVGKWRRGNEIQISLSSLGRVAAALGRDVQWFLIDHDAEEAAA